MMYETLRPIRVSYINFQVRPHLISLENFCYIWVFSKLKCLFQENTTEELICDVA